MLDVLFGICVIGRRIRTGINRFLAFLWRPLLLFSPSHAGFKPKRKKKLRYIGKVVNMPQETSNA